MRSSLYVAWCMHAPDAILTTGNGFKVSPEMAMASGATLGEVDWRTTL
jgi:hypothetical protein